MADNPPPSLKAIQPFLVISKQFTKRDPVVSYYAKMYAVQEGIRLARSDQGAKGYLLTLMDQIETMKAALKADHEEAVSNDVVGQAHIETVAFKLFEFADNEDRASRFTRNMIKAFFTSSQLFTILKQFGELSDEVEEKMKYSKWKAVEIDRCLKNGITPTPGPPGEQTFEEDFAPAPPPPVGFNVQPPPDDNQAGPSWEPTPPPETRPTPKPRHAAPQNPTPQVQPEVTPAYDGSASGGGWNTQPVAMGRGPVAVQLGPSEISRAQKLCKFASSALEYDDVQGAVEFLGKAMNLLQTGKEEG